MYPAPTGHMAVTPSRLQGSMPMRYPSPFFDIASTWYPRTIRELLQYCRVYFYTQPLIAATLSKLARYSVTDVVVTHKVPAVTRNWEWLIREQLKFRSFLTVEHLENLVHGGCFVSLIFPMIRHLMCTSCGNVIGAKNRMDDWNYQSGRFMLLCPKCKHKGPAKIIDVPIRSPRGIHLHRWDPMDIIIDDGEYPGTTRYLYRVPRTLANSIRLGKKQVVSVVPLEFLEAVEQSKSVILDQDNFRYIKREPLSGRHKGWGMPLLAPVLKYMFFLQIMMKSQESLLVEHLIPLRIVFPQSGSPLADPMAMVWMETWKRKVDSEIRRWRLDPCVTPSTLVVTPSGLVRAGNLKIGDLVKSHTGRMIKIEAIARRALKPKEKAYRIVARGLHAVDSVFSENHPIWAAQSFNNGNGHKLGGAEFISVKYLRKGDYVGYPVTRRTVPRDAIDMADYTDRASTPSWVYVDYADPTSPLIFERLERGENIKQGQGDKEGWSINEFKIAKSALRHKAGMRRIPRFLPFDDELAWIVGLYLAEGNRNVHQLTFALHRKETNLISRVRRFFKDRFKASSFVAKRGKNGVQVFVSSLIAADVFGALCPGTSRTKQVHQIYKESEDHIARSLVCGWLSGDGTLYKGGPHKVAGISSSIQLAEDMRFLLLSLGIPVGIRSEEPHEYNICGKRGMSGWSYRVQASADSDVILSWMDKRYSGKKSFSKIGVYRDGWFWHRIEAIKEVSRDEVPEVLDIRTAKDHSFCTWGVATHNCYIPVLPVPVGSQTIGGEGRSLMLGGEIRMLLEQIIAALEVPMEFVFSGTSYTASMVSLRQLENLCLTQVEDDRELLRWIVDKVAGYLYWPKPSDIHFKPFKSADDLARKQFMLALKQNGCISGHTLDSNIDVDYSRELEIMKEEALAEAEINKIRGKVAMETQGEAAVTQAKYQVRAQAAAAQQAKAMQQEPLAGITPPGGAGGPQNTEQPYPQAEDSVIPQSPIEDTGLDIRGTVDGGVELFGGTASVPLFDFARTLSSHLGQVAPGDRQSYLDNLRASNPQLHGIVMQFLAPQAQVPSDKLPPRREVAVI